MNNSNGQRPPIRTKPIPKNPPAKKKYKSTTDVFTELYQPIKVVGGKRLYKTAEDFADKINEYFLTCCEQGIIPTKTRLAQFLGFSRKETINDYALHGPDYAEVVNKVNLHLEGSNEDALVNRDIKGNIIGIIFSLKNNYGWVDRTETSADYTLEVIPRETLEADLEQRFARIADARREVEMVEAIEPEST